MPISGDTPKHLVVGARGGFLTAVKGIQADYTKFTETFNMTTAEQELVDLGDAPMPKNSPSGMTVQDFIEKSMTLKPKEWDITVFVEHKLNRDDQTKQLMRKVRGAGRNFQKHINSRAYKYLNAGDAATYGLCYDEQFFYDTDHKDKGAQYQTNQSNVNGNNLSITNFNTSWANAKAFKDDQGEYKDYHYDLLVCHTSNRLMAAQIAENPQREGTGNRDINPFSGEISYVLSPELDANAWLLLATAEEVKPLILALRTAPHLLHTWFEPNRPGGGWHMFKFWAEYELFYGDWRTAIMGQT